MTGQLIIFSILAAISVVCGIGMILQENPVRSALCLVLVLFSVALLYFTLHATFIGAVQIIVYAGAIMVLFIFVIMLLNLGTPERIADKLRPQRPLAFIAGFATVIVLASVIVALPAARHAVMLPMGLTGPYEIGLALYDPKQPWLFPFEVVSILLLVAAVGAVMLAKKRI
jgi:NADH-quinone oxidoreductase subunit J